MKKVVISVLVAMNVFVSLALESRKVALVVQNHAAPGAAVPFMALTDALTAKLAGCGLQVINPYNSVGVNQNRAVTGEKTPEVSAMELARRLKSDGAITASVIEFLDSTIGTPPSVHQYSIRITLNLADAWTEAVVIPGAIVAKESPRYTNNQVSQNKQKYLGDLMCAAADECVAKLKQSPEFRKWMKTPIDESAADGLVERLKKDAGFRKWIEAIVDERLTARLAKDSKDNAPVMSFDKIVDELAAMMAWDEQFKMNYEEQKKKAERLPIVIIGSATNETKHTEFDAGLKSSGRRFRDKLRTSGRFDVKEDGVIVDLANRITESRKNGLETGDLMKVWETHGSPDFFVVVGLNDVTELDGSTVYEYNITIHSLRSGLVVWSGTKKFNLNRGAAK